MSARTGLWLATWGGCGYAPWAPGTLASLVATGLGYGLVQALEMPPVGLVFAALLLGWPAVRATEVAQKHFAKEDPREVVIDEVLGQWIALSAADPGRAFDWVAALLLFRLFDVLKPFPIRRLERLPGAYGVLVDDLAAGFCAMIVVLGLHRAFSS